MNHEQEQSRRLFLLRSAAATAFVAPTILVPPLGWAMESPTTDDASIVGTSTIRPYATSVQALIPAIRVRRVLDRAVALTKQWRALPSNDTAQSEIVQQLQELLLQKQNYTRLYKVSSSKLEEVAGKRPETTATKPLLPSQSYMDLYNQKRKDLSIWEKPGALFVQGGEIGTWKALKRNEYNKEGMDEMRAALNLYTSNLVYASTQYTLRVSKEERSQMIREDRLPDLLTQVVPSDMDLRDLYRNALLTAVQEARAELSYQMRSNEAGTDLTDLLNLLMQAQEALNQWFAFIDLREIADAERADAYK